jgi:hypothetical protein
MILSLILYVGNFSDLVFIMYVISLTHSVALQP